jgi:hypothetical protein
MRRTLGVLALLSLVAGGLVGVTPSPARAQDERCFSPEFLIAQARAERPSTQILARHSGSEAAALVEAMNILDADAEEDATPAADEITVLRSGQSDEVLLLGAEEGCLVWRGETTLSDYQHAIWRAFGLPV